MKKISLILFALAIRAKKMRLKKLIKIMLKRPLSAMPKPLFFPPLILIKPYMILVKFKMVLLLKRFFHTQIQGDLLWS